MYLEGDCWCLVPLVMAAMSKLHVSDCARLHMEDASDIAVARVKKSRYNEAIMLGVYTIILIVQQRY